ncbi:MAG: DEAD/DEAH box helicase family protein [Myxococcales bacterium]|nr:DEAD/DEAH box helicase family protein [Myxococcales bacterium]
MDGIEAGVLADGKRQIGEVLTVATPQGALAALEMLRGRVGLVLVDEAHHAGAATWRELLLALPRRRTFGFTATVRQDALWRAVLAHVGPVVHEVPRAALERAGLLVVPSYRAIETGWSFDYSGPEDWIALQAALEVDVDRRDLVADTFAGAVRGRGLGLLLCGRVEYSKLLAVELRARGLRAAALFGSMPAKERSATLAAARAGDLDVLTATSLADEGLDLPALRVLGLAWPSRAEPRLLQRIGRVLRPSEGKDGALVIDFVDAAGPLENQGRIRARLFAKHWGRP